MKPILISGSLAFDTIMVYHGKFRDQIMPNQLHMLNLVFMVPTMRREFGGCAGNIAYNLKLLGGNPFVVAAVGKDFSPYYDHLTRLDINQQGIYTAGGHYTAQAFITNDEEDNQITAFHPGAMQEAHRALIPNDVHAEWGIVSPNGKEAMVAHVREWSQKKINVIFDPGQGLPMFSGDELKALLPLAQALIVNDYEMKLMSEKMDMTTQAIAKSVGNGMGVLIETLGGEGCYIYQAGKKTHVKAMVAEKIVDPTGCGDAFRGGLLRALNTGKNWQQAAQLGCVVAGVKIAFAGGQNHPLTRDAISKQYMATYGEALKD